MRAWAVERPGPIDGHPLVAVDRPVPEPGPGEVRVTVRACGVCRTDLHLAEGDLAPRRAGRRARPPSRRRRGRPRPGRDALPRSATASASPGCATPVGVCRFCRRGDENLCVAPRFTGWDDDGGYAEQAVVPEAFAYPIPDGFTDVEAAPLLCAGIIGYRALRRAALPPGGRLGIYGFGASAHITAQLAMHEGADRPRAHPLARGAAARPRARRRLGRRRRRRAARAARRRGALRPRRRAGAGRAARPRPRRHARRSPAST